MVPSVEELDLSEEFGSGIGRVSAERLGDFDGEHLLLGQRPGSPQTVEELSDLNPLYGQLPAVQSGRVGIFNEFDLYGDVAGWQRVLDALVELVGPR